MYGNRWNTGDDEKGVGMEKKIGVECGGREATKEELKAWQQVEEKIKEQERKARRS